MTKTAKYCPGFRSVLRNITSREDPLHTYLTPKHVQGGFQVVSAEEMMIEDLFI